MAAPCNIRRFPGFIGLVNHATLASILSPWLWRMEPPAANPAPVDPVDATDDDGATFIRAAGGDARAWQELFDRWKKPLLAFFYRSLGSMPEAEDLTLEVFVRLHRASSRYEPRARFAAYLFHIAQNLLRNELRRRRRKPAAPLPPDAFDYLESPAAAEGRRLSELEEEFQRALGQLPEAQRTLLLLVHQQNLEPDAAAQILGVTANALRVQLHRARQRLKELMTSRP